LIVTTTKGEMDDSLLELVQQGTIGAEEAAHRAELQVHVWTIDDPIEMKRLLDLGVDGIMTDRPEILKKVMQDNSCWHGN